MPLNTQYIRYKNTFSSENHIEYIYFFHKHDKDSFMLNESNFLQKFNNLLWSLWIQFHLSP